MRQDDSESDDMCARGATTVRDSTRRDEDGSDDVCDRGATTRTKGQRLESDRESCYRQSGVGATVGLHAGEYMFPTPGSPAMAFPNFSPSQSTIFQFSLQVCSL